MKKIKNKVKLQKPLQKKRMEVLPSKPIKNEIIKEEDIISFETVDTIPVSLDCHLKFTGDALKKCVNSSLAKHVRRKFNIDLALNLNLSGKIKVKTSFIINTNGDIVNIKVEAPNKVLSDEAIRTVNLIPRMIPGKHNGKPINVSYKLPIKFQIAN
jgi:protein TonB